MTTFKELVAQYKAASVSSSGEVPGKIEVIDQLSDNLSSDALEFLVEIISDPGDYDLARIEALKTVQFLEPQHDHLSAKVANAVLIALSDEDILVQQWAAIAAASFTDHLAVFDRLLALLEDPEQDLDVRHNCLAAVRQAGPSPKALSCLERVSSDTEIGQYAGDLLRSWGRI